MKCPKCGSDNYRTDVEAMVCHDCKHEESFDATIDSLEAEIDRLKGENEPFTRCSECNEPVKHSKTCSHYYPTKLDMERE